MAGVPSQDLLEDLTTRFIFNASKEDQGSFERILFLIENAHWFYEDNFVDNDPSLKSLTLKEFTILIFKSCDIFKAYVTYVDHIFKDFNSYKVKVPVIGAIILDESQEKCLLVKDWKKDSWGFPRGKKGKNEEDHITAVREVLEETGFDISELMKKEEFIESIFDGKRVRLYIIPGVKNDTYFAPRTKKEISNIAWHRLEELEPSGIHYPKIKLFMAPVFLPRLRRWVYSHRKNLMPG